MSTAMMERKDTARSMVEKHQDKIAALLPAHVNVERFAKSALLAISRNPDLEKCTAQSVFTSVLNAAELGLDFTPAKGHAYLVPYKNVATFMPGYRGMIDLAKRSGTVNRIEAHIVHKNDRFLYKLGLNPVLEHEPVLDGDSGDMIGAYAIAWFKDGGYQYEYMKKNDIDKIRARAKTDYVWKSDYEEMARKTVVRRLFKYLPCSPDLEKAMEYDNASTGVDTIEPTGSAGNRTSELADLVSGMGETNATDAEYEDVVDAPPPSSAEPKTKDDYIKALQTLQEPRGFDDETFTRLVCFCVQDERDNWTDLPKDKIASAYSVISDDEACIKLTTAFNEASKGGNLFDKQ